MTTKERKKYTADASMILKWFTQEKERDREKALQLRNDFKERLIDIFCPELLIYEIANVLRYKENLEEIFVLKAIASLYAMELLMPVNQKIMENAVKMARKYDITVYDSTYLSFAQHHGYNLITADKSFLEKTQDLAWAIHIYEY